MAADFFDSTVSLLQYCARIEEEADDRTAEYILSRLEMVVRGADYNTTDLTSMLSTGPISVAQAIGEIIVKLSYFKDCLLNVIECWRTREQTVRYRQFAAPSVRTGGPGRSKFEIKLEQLEELRYIGLTWTDIAKLLGVSRMTVYRARQELGCEEAGDRNVTDADLQQLIVYEMLI